MFEEVIIGDRTVEIQARMDGREVLEVGTWKASH